MPLTKRQLKKIQSYWERNQGNKMLEERIQAIRETGVDPYPGTCNSQIVEDRLAAAAERIKTRESFKLDPKPDSLIPGIEERVASLFWDDVWEFKTWS